MHRVCSILATESSTMARAVFRSLVCFLVVVQLTILGRCQQVARSCGNQDTSYIEEGDMMIGGLIPLHYTNLSSDSTCSPLRSIKALREVEAMVYAIGRINRNRTLLPGVRLGYHIRDTFYSVPATLRSSLNFIPGFGDRDRPVVGVVGARRSSCSEQAAILLGLYQVPQVSYLSTSDVLSIKSRYPYFMRVVSPDIYQVQAIVDLLVEFHWSYVTFISSDEIYGHNGQQEFQRLSADGNICTSMSSYRTVSAFAEQGELDSLIQGLLDLQVEIDTVVVVLFVDIRLARKIFRAAYRVGAKRRFVWIGSDGWGNYGEAAIIGFEEVTVGAFTLSPLSRRLEDFDEYFGSLNTSSNNPWLREFLEKYTTCSSDGLGCDQPGLIRQADNGKVAHETLVMDSVFTFAHGLDRMRRDLCPDTEEGLCSNMTEIDGDVLLYYMLKTEFESLANGWISFTPEGNMYGRYSVNHLQMNRTSGEYSFQRVGEWKQSVDPDAPNLKIEPGLPWYLWDGASVDPTTGIPRSVCSDPCKPGEKTNRIPDNLCCWTCTPCEQSEIVVDNGTSCESCIDADNMRFAWPNGDKTVCVDIPSDFNLREQAWAIAIITVACVFVLATIFVLAVYIYNQEMPLIKASSRELSYIIFVGILLSYVTAIVFSVAPSPFVCVLRRLGPSVAASFIYASIATKTIRLFRIFRASTKSAKRPNYIGSMFQVVLSLSTSALAVIWTTVWLIVDPPRVILKMPNEENKLQVTCQLNFVETVGVMLWDVALIIVCCVFAFMTRKLPENYNETRFITFCSFCTLVVYVTFSPIYFTSKEPYYQASYYSAGLIINATVTLTCLFVIKIYALYFVDEDEMNIFTQSRLRANTKTSSGRGLQFPTTSSSGANEDHLNPNYVTETGRYLSAPGSGEPTTDVSLIEENRLRTSSNSSKSNNSNKSNSSRTSSTGGVMERLRGTNKVDPSDATSESRDGARPNGIATLDKIVRSPGKASPSSAKETKVFFSPDVVECDTNM